MILDTCFCNKFQGTCFCNKFQGTCFCNKFHTQDLPCATRNYLSTQLLFLKKKVLNYSYNRASTSISQLKHFKIEALNKWQQP